MWSIRNFHSLLVEMQNGTATLEDTLAVLLFTKLKYSYHKTQQGFPVAQWLRVCLPMQGTRVRALAWEDPTCRRATRPVSHNC